ncbi:hypothetical protein Q8W71_20265 [Methylobacterium sp. NEAU 140]|uniref:hypothetical protein n=1 Tax=Methylobacterium sp. NEAU 140 TaxID=3064945 RepID=UPI0027375462|nr:hypothetical protein [Methylobacterium sp. NEAU 140]MDP4024967.1 hypothetical protein [Methylobacterium sp. NEAU 140]
MPRSLLPGALVALFTLAGAAEAAPAGRAAKPAEAPSPIQPVAAVEHEEPTTCSRIRRRLWIENEGWIVRRITTCR